MADVKMPKSVPCKFDEKGWAPCKKPSTNGFCSKHEKEKCISCGEQALRSCDTGMGGLECGASLCSTCKHSLEDNTHVGKLIYDIQLRDREEFRKTGKESDRLLALRGLPTHVPLPANLEELLAKKLENIFGLKICYYLLIKHGLMGTFPAILKDTQIMVITPDKDAIIRVWKSLSPRDSEIVSDVWRVNEEIGVAYRMTSDRSEQTQSRPLKLFSRKEIEKSFAGGGQPFQWAPGIFGAEIPQSYFEQLIQKECEPVNR